jgi:hypothetical protein
MSKMLLTYNLLVPMNVPSIRSGVFNSLLEKASPIMNSTSAMPLTRPITIPIFIPAPLGGRRKQRWHCDLGLHSTYPLLVPIWSRVWRAWQRFTPKILGCRQENVLSLCLRTMPTSHDDVRNWKFWPRSVERR